MGFNTFPCNPYPISTEELNKGNNDDLNTRVTALEGEVSDLNSTKANQITIAPFFSAEASYSVGDLVYYNGLTYRCTNDHEGEWDADDFSATTIAGELDTLKSGLTGVTDVDISAITLETGIAWNASKSSYLKKRCGQLYGNLFFNGLLDMSANPFKKIGVISSPYIPIANSRMPVYLQTDSDIVIGVLVVFAVTGNIFVIAPKGNYGKSDGTGANSWCTSDGVYVNMLV